MSLPNVGTGASQAVARRAFLAGLVGIAGISVLACAGGSPAQPTANAALAPTAPSAAAATTPAGSAMSPTAAPKPTPRTSTTVTPQAQAASAVDHSGQILLTPEQQYGVGSGLQVVANLYMKKYPNVKVQVDVKPQDGYSDWARAQITGGTKSSMMTATFLQDLLAADKFVDLTPYLQRQSPYVDKKWIDTFQPGTWRPDSPTNAIQQMNLMRTNVVWFYNQDLFKKAGLDPTKPPTTWTELMNIAETLKKAGIQAFSIEGDYDGFWRMNLGWWRRLFLDSYIRDTVQYTRSQKGDFNYRPDVDGKWQYNPK